ncbi:MAG TPA: ABC transporter ATP-binding protein [Bacilli bacterium]
MSETPILQIQNLSKQIGGKTIIDNLTLDVPRGEVFGFLGPNGAGKTTTIRMLVGLMSITQGKIIVNGINLSTHFEKAMRHIGTIVENPEMYKFMTGYQNLKHFSLMMGGIKKQRIHEVVELVGLQNRIHDKVKRYSLGMRQRLGVAQALLHKPALLILDEPTNGLDPAGIRELRDYLRSLAKNEGITIMVSSHLLTEMELMCDRVAIIHHGKLVDIKLLKDIHKGEGQEFGNRLLFEVDQPAKSAEIIAVYLPEVRIEPTETGVSLSLQREQAAEINLRLVQAGIKVYRIKEITTSLEDSFLEMTRGEQIV